MWIRGVELPDSAAASLALRLHRAGHRELSMRIGLAMDANRQMVGLSAHERAQIRSNLAQDCPPTLIALRDALA